VSYFRSPQTDRVFPPFSFFSLFDKDRPVFPQYALSDDFRVEVNRPEQLLGLAFSHFLFFFFSNVELANGLNPFFQKREEEPPLFSSAASRTVSESRDSPCPFSLPFPPFFNREAPAPSQENHRRAFLSPFWA